MECAKFQYNLPNISIDIPPLRNLHLQFFLERKYLWDKIKDNKARKLFFFILKVLLRPRLHETGRMSIRMKIRPDCYVSAKKFVHLTFPFTRSKQFVHLTFPFTWELPESIIKAAFGIPAVKIVVHKSTDSNIKTTLTGFVLKI